MSHKIRKLILGGLLILSVSMITAGLLYLLSDKDDNTVIILCDEYICRTLKE